MCENGLEEGEREPSNSSIEEVGHVLCYMLGRVSWQFSLLPIKGYLVHTVASLQLLLVVLPVFYFSNDTNTYEYSLVDHLINLCPVFAIATFNIL